MVTKEWGNEIWYKNPLFSYWVVAAFDTYTYTTKIQNNMFVRKVAVHLWNVLEVTETTIVSKKLNKQLQTLPVL
jgi:hypothetical protein